MRQAGRLVITFFLYVAIIGAGCYSLRIAARAARVSSRIYGERLIGKGSR
jgi:hypothetical protein